MYLLTRFRKSQRSEGQTLLRDVKEPLFVFPMFTVQHG